MTYSARIELTGQSLELEARLIPITREMNCYPLRVNKATWETNLACAEESAEFLTGYCRHLAGDEFFRPNSPADCARVLFTDDVPTKKGKSGRPVTDKDTLGDLANKGNSLAQAILDARSSISRHSQLKKWSSFALLGEVQCVWDSMGTPSGRYTSAKPCLCNRIDLIRESIEPDQGHVFLSLDLGAAEYVTWASLSGDLVLGEAFYEGRDFHLEMAHAVKELVPSWDLRGADLRSAGKCLNFSILYQMQPFTLARKLGCSTETATKIISAYYGRAKTAAKYIQRVLSNARKVGYVQTHYGRRRYCPELTNGYNDREIREIEKTLWSHVNSGTAAEYLKWKQVHGWEALRANGFTPTDARLALQIYDECVFSVREDLAEKAHEILKEVWLRREVGFLPFKSEIKTGQNWRICS